MTVRRVTIGVIIAATVGLIGWDVAAVLMDPSATISSVFLDASRVHGTWAYLLGVLAVHLAWPVRGPMWSVARWAVGIAAGIALAVAAWFVHLPPYVWLLAGLATGRFEFAQFEPDEGAGG